MARAESKCSSCGVAYVGVSQLEEEVYAWSLWHAFLCPNKTEEMVMDAAKIIAVALMVETWKGG